MIRSMQWALLVLIPILSSTARPADKDILKIGMTTEFENLNPMVAEQAATKYMLYMAWRPLVVLSPENKWTPLLIKAIPTVENKMVKKKSPGMEVTFDLLDDAKWGDGTPVTCKDIEFAWRVGVNPNVSNPDRERFNNVKSVTWTPASPKKCVLVFEKIKFDFFYNMPDPLPEHLEGPVFNKFKDQAQGYDHNSLYTKEPSNPGLYNGPYRISEVKLGSHLIFVPNPQFHGKKASFKQVIFKLIPNASVLTANLQSGDIEMISSAAGIDLSQAVAFERKIKLDNLPYKVNFVPGVIYSHIDFNLDHPALSDRRVREALSRAFNKIEIVETAMEGKATPAIHFVNKEDPWFTDKVSMYKYDKKEAAKLLDQAGWKMGPKGYRQKDGKNLTLTIYATAGIRIVELIETYLQGQFKAVGVELIIKNEPGRVFFGETIKHRKFDLAFYSWVATPENSPRSTLHSAEIPSAKNSWSGQNNPGYKNPEVDKLIDSLEAELNAKKRVDIARKIQEHYAKDIPVIPVYYRPNNSVTPADMKGYRLSGHLFYETLHSEEWSR